MSFKSFIPYQRRSVHAVIVTGVLVTTLGLVSIAHADPQAADNVEVASSIELDVPYVPTPEPVVEGMMEMGAVSEGNRVIDLGSGDGRIAIAAAKLGAQVLGVDIDPERIREADENAEREGVTDRVEFRQEDLFDTPIADADVLTLYLLPTINQQLRPKILTDMAPGSRVVSHAFDMGNWASDERRTIAGRTVYLWHVPARIEGEWQLMQGDTLVNLTLSQRYQEVRGVAQRDGQAMTVGNARLLGDRIAFTLADGEHYQRFYGRVDQDRIQGVEPVEALAGPGEPVEADWQAERES
ncbi:Methyltransferase domain-containing protein [Kushneria avicenniae]|uniref:Methyltransferase domain-containing protein n=1 Tax=Kushneria avicenniae TaxID=402385 RepID=A0A1I1LTU4_9GAMM|nr:methyltransferase domain-containing protein [Kushneria avicenniae]SFC75912.1 Methyltransferase domain-containing protein [Kushneria avicenniae]